MVKITSRSEQQKLYGIDCGDGIVFGGGTWAPGGEHSKKIQVKNVSTHTIKFKYELPSSKYFSMEFPELTTLSPGTMKMLPISFRPVKYEAYDDTVLFIVHRMEHGKKASTGKFCLPVTAAIAKLKVNVPESIDFEYCPTMEQTIKTIHLTNTGQIVALFKWKMPNNSQPFTITPESGSLQPGKSIAITCIFLPNTATVYDAPVQCVVQEMGDNNQSDTRIVHVYGIGKYTHLVASTNELDFGEILVGATGTTKAPTEMDITLRNPSLVRANFQIKNVQVDQQPTFFCSPLKAVIDAGSEMTIKVKYVPRTNGEFTSERFSISTPGGNTVYICCKGMAIGPRVSIWKKNLASNLVRGNAINFGDIEIGKKTTRVIILKNDSDVVANFQFICPQNGVFSADKTCGTIPKLLETGVTFAFEPTNPGNFYRRVFCLIHNQFPIHIDILGTAYNAKCRPSPFHQAHVLAYRLRLERGLALLSPDKLDEHRQEHGDECYLSGAMARMKENAALDNAQKSPSSTKQVTRSGEATVEEAFMCREFCINSYDNGNAVVLGQKSIDFGNASLSNMSEKQLLHVKNCTKGKVTCDWNVSLQEDYKSGTMVRNFAVYPSSQDISPGETAEFKVAFHPQVDNYYYFAELEAHVYFKSNRTFRLVNEQTFTPPWCIVVNAFGNTFGSSNQFLSKVEFHVIQNRICLPPCYLGDSVFHTFMMSNPSDTPALYRFKPDSLSVFTVKPDHGLIRPNSFQLIQIRFTPRKQGRHSYKLRCNINNSVSGNAEIDVCGTGCLPELKFGQGVSELDEKLYLRPTSIGLSSAKTFKIKNASRIPLIFRWDVPLQVAEVINIFPKVGRMNGNEEVKITCNFHPKSQKQYDLRSTVDIKSIAACSGEAKSEVALQRVLKVTAKATTGAITFVPNVLNFDTILVNSSTQRKLCIVNSSDSDLRYEIRCSLQEKSILNVDELTDSSAENSTEGIRQMLDSSLAFTHSKSTLPARSHRQLVATFCPGFSGSFYFDIQCDVQMVSNSAEKIIQPLKTSNLLCHAEGHASFPTLMIQDVYIKDLPKQVMWNQLNIGTLNYFLKAPLTKSELKLNRESSPDVNELSKFEMNFTPAILGGATESIILQLENPGCLTVDYSLRFPNESEIEMEQWADAGEPSNLELCQNNIIDNQIFQVFPKKGQLKPKQTATIEIQYAPISSKYHGIHELPVIVQVEKGKQFIILLKGRTLEKNEPALFLTNDILRLSPVEIGDADPPLQRTQIFNSGSTPLRYILKAESSPDEIKNQNYGVEVLQSFQSEGVIQAHSSAFLEWIFSPVEEKEYSMRFKILYQGIRTPQYTDSCNLQVIAYGYHGSNQSFNSARESRQLVLPPERQLYIPNEQLATCSVGLFNLGQIPKNTLQQQILILKSQCAEAIWFHWDGNCPLVANQTVQFFPADGQLHPGEHAVIRVSINSGSKSQILNEAVKCYLQKVQSPPEEYGRTKRSRLPKTSSRTSVELRETRSSISLHGGNATSLSSLHANPEDANHTSSRSKMQRAPSRASNLQSSSSQNIDPLIDASSISIHIFFSSVSENKFYEQYGKEALAKHQPIFAEHKALAASPKNEIKLDARLEKWRRCRETVHDIMSHLCSDIVNLPIVHQTFRELPDTAPSPLFKQFTAKRDPFQPSKLSTYFQSSEHQQLAANILENTVFNLIQDISHGDFILTSKNKRIVCLD